MEEIIFRLVAGSGDARSDLMQAIRKSSNNDFEGADELLHSGSERLFETHKIQTGIIQQEAKGQGVPYSLLMCHAQDHLMTTSLLNDLAKELVSLNKRLAKLEGKL